MEIKDYIEVLKEINQLEKKNGMDLDKDIVITILQEYGKDRRTELMNKNKKFTSPNPKEPATEKQKFALKKMGIKFDKDITKREAFAIIKENKENSNY